MASADISAMLLLYGVAGAQARTLLIELWQRVLSELLADNALTDKKIAYLRTLRGVLGLTQAESEEAERTVIHPRYAMAVGDAMADRYVSPKEREALAKLAEQLRLPQEVERDIRERAARCALDSLVRKTTSDRRLSPDELNELALVARHLGIDATFDDATESLLDRFALFWRIENGDCPVTEPPVPLSDGELCYFHCAAAWHRPLSWSGPGDHLETFVSVRVARGVYYRLGTASNERLNRRRVKEMDSGRLLITNRRIIFEGDQGTIRRGLRSVDAFQVLRDAIILEKAGGRGLYLTLDGDVELAAVVLGAALSRA